MKEDIELLYSEDYAAKIEHLQRHVQARQATAARGDAPRPSLLFLKALHRVLNDDFQKSAELTLVALKCLYLLFTLMPVGLRADFLQETNPDVFLLVCVKICAWEFRRLDRLYARFLESGNPKPVNAAAALQTRIFALQMLMLREIGGFYAAAHDARLSDFRRHICDFGLAASLVRALDYEDPLLLKTALSFFAELADEELALHLIRRGLLIRLPRFIGQREYAVVFALLGRLLAFPSVREEMHASAFLLRALVRALAQNQIALALQAINLLSLEPSAVAALVEAGLDAALLALLAAFMAKDAETVEKNKLLWNVLANLATHACFADRLLRAPAFAPLFDALLKSRSAAGLCFLDNLFAFATDAGAKSAFGAQTAALLELLERCEEGDALGAPRLLGILGELHALPDRRAITVMMRLAKKKPAPALMLGVFGFLNKALCRPHFDREIVSGHVIDHVRQRYLAAPLEEEARLQLLFFLVNAVVVKQRGLSFEEFLDFVARFAERDIRLTGFVLAAFDVFLWRAAGEAQAAQVRERKLPFCGAALGGIAGAPDFGPEEAY